MTNNEQVEIEAPSKYVDEIVDALNRADDHILSIIERYGSVPTYIHISTRDIAMIFLAGQLEVVRDLQGRQQFVTYRGVMVKVDER